MKRQNLKNEEIDQIGSRLHKVTKPSDEEIEKIVGNPRLFDSIQTRIKADERLNLESERGFVNWNWLKLSFLNRQMAISAVAILIVFMFFAALFVLRSNESTKVAQEKKIVKPKIQPGITKAENSLSDPEIKIEKDFLSEYESDKEIFSKINKSPKRIRKKYPANSQRVSAKISSKPKRVQKQNIVQKESRQVAKKEPQKIFYSLPFAETSETGSETLQVVSTKLSRSELFALGVNLQLENENSTVETELLVGDDGVARAIRVIEKY